MTTERVFRVLWGSTLENVLDFTWPVVGASPTFWRQPRPQSTLVPNGASNIAWITGRYFRLKVTAQYFGGPQNFGATGLQAFLDWAMDSNTFTLVPNLALPALTVPGCYLEGPFTDLGGGVSLEQDGTQTLDLTILHPTRDLGVAWRGLFFEYVAGGSLTDPTAFTFSRASVGYEITPQGYLLSHPTDNVCDGHYGDPLVGAGGQGTLVERAFTNDIPNPEDLTNASWSKSEFTVSANNAPAPDKNITADLLVESVTASAFHSCAITTGITITAGDAVTVLAFVRDGGRHRGLLRVTNLANTNGVGVNYNLQTGTLTSAAIGSGTLAASTIVALAGGWFMIWFRGVIDGAATSYFLKFFTQDSSGNNSYTGDGASGVYFWGATAVHTAANLLASYTPTSSSADLLYAPFANTPTDLNNCTVYVKALRPLWVGAGASGTSPALFAVGRGASAGNPSLTIFADPGASTLFGMLRTGAGDSSTAGQAIPAGAAFDMIVQFKNLLTGGQAALDVGSGLGAFATAAPAIAAFGAAFIRIGQYDEQWNGAVTVVKVAPGLQTLATMRFT